MRIAALFVLLVTLAVVRVPASDTPLQTAALAWDAGDYVTALTTYLKLLDAGADDATFEAIALQTGELFETREITADGDAPVFSPDGRLFAYEAGDLLEPLIVMHDGDGHPKPLAQLRGFRPAFSRDGSKLAYLKLAAVSTALRDAYNAMGNAAQTERTQRTAAFNALRGRESRLTVRDLTSGAETEVATGALSKTGVSFGAGGTLLVTAAAETGPPQVYVVAAGREPSALTSGAGEKVLGAVNADGTAALYTVRVGRGGRGQGGGQGGGGRGNAAQAPAGRGTAPAQEAPAETTDAPPQTPITFGVVLLPEARAVTVTGSAPAFSRDGRTLAYVRRERDDYQIAIAPAANPTAATVAHSGAARVDAPALSPDGSRVAFQMMPKEDWEIFVAARDGKDERRVTREIQHDIVPQFLSNDLLLASIGEPRHRRSYLYDLTSMKRLRLFHNNSVRTIAPEYAWAAAPGGTTLLIVAERDGDTVSPERGLYFVDLSRRVSRGELRARVQANLDAEQALRAKGQKMFAPIAAAVGKVVADASAARVFGYEKTLYDFDSKHITRPGNRLASAYLFDTYKSFGYEPAYQWFEPRNALGGQTANVVATLKGTVNPELVYVVSSHYDSVAVGPGADDDTSGTAALLETARLMANHPQPATIVFASFTGEEAGLLGSREFVRRAVADKVKIVGALNNDMVGWANDHRLDNTIRYSNPGIRDVQHAAAMQFSRLITYDALYYKSTDAAAYYEAYGDIVGGIGSYPVLGNPHYHQSHDILETINHQLVTEVARTTAATLMLLASSPSRLTDLKATRTAGGVALTWTPSPESGITGYIVSYGTAAPLRVTKPAATLPALPRGTVVSVKAVNAKGMEGWDAARVRVE
jgi:Tol biopolymer transport system component